MKDWFAEAAEKAFKKAIVRNPEYNTIAQWRAAHRVCQAH